MFELNGYIYRFYRVYNEHGQKVNYECHITTKPEGCSDEHFITSGKARLNPKDKFDKRIGKLIALKNALDSLEVGRPVNKKVMAKFEEEHARGRV